MKNGHSKSAEIYFSIVSIIEFEKNPICMMKHSIQKRASMIFVSASVKTA